MASKKKKVFGPVMVFPLTAVMCSPVRQTALWMLFFWLLMLSFKLNEAFQVIKIMFLLSWSMTPVIQHFTFIWDCKTYLRACVNKISHTWPHILLNTTLLACLSLRKSCYHSWSEDVTSAASRLWHTAGSKDATASTTMNPGGVTENTRVDNSCDHNQNLC